LSEPILIPTISDVFKKEFWSQVEIKGTDECWFWLGGSRDQRGYGVVWTGGKMIRCHRLSILLTYGIDPGENLVLHDCDNPCCVNPNHLYIGTDQNNSQDRINRGRHCGSNGYCRILSDTQAQEIRLKRFMGIAVKELAKEYGTSVRTIYYVLAHESGY